MPRCLRCSKKFSSNMRVLAHMNNPRTSCHTHYEELVSAAKVLARFRQRKPSPLSNLQHPPVNLETSDLQGGFEAECSLGTEATCAFDVNMDEASTSLASNSEELNPPKIHLEEYPGASRTYGMGKSFMDAFNADEHAKERSQCLYYPFASQDEWQLASYLLQSKLSMAQIDQFLKLKMVCFFGPYPQAGIEYITSYMIRFNSWISPFATPKI